MKRFDERRKFSAVLVLAAILSVAAAGASRADDGQGSSNGPGTGTVHAPAPPTANSPPPQPQPPVANKPGFLHELGAWWNQSFSGFSDKMKNARDQFDDFNKKQTDTAKDAAAVTGDAVKNAAQAAKDAAAAVVRLPNMRAVDVRERCDSAANGAPDCDPAAANACRKKGFSDGKPIDVSTSRECSATVGTQGQPTVAAGCKDVATVLRAICQ